MAFLTLRRVSLCFWCPPKLCFPSPSSYPVCSLWIVFLFAIFFPPSTHWFWFLCCYFQFNLVLTACLGLHAHDMVWAPRWTSMYEYSLLSNRSQLLFKITFPFFPLKCTVGHFLFICTFFLAPVVAKKPAKEINICSGATVWKVQFELRIQ